MWEFVLSLQEQVAFLRNHFGSELRDLRHRISELESSKAQVRLPHSALARKEEDIEKSLSKERVGLGL